MRKYRVRRSIFIISYLKENKRKKRRDKKILEHYNETV